MYMPLAGLGFAAITISINCRMSTFHLYYCIPTNASNLT